MLKNSNFSLDHNLEDPGGLDGNFLRGFGGPSGHATCDPLVGLPVATTGVDNTIRADARFYW
jgi:hypothetical protein